jgi:hypothetical protein
VKNKTEEFLGERATWEQAELTLDELHSLWGGKRVVVRGDGASTVKVVDLADNVEIYSLHLDAELVAALFEMCTFNDILSVTFPARDGAAEETAGKIVLGNAAGQMQETIYRSGDPLNAHFEEVRTALSALYENLGELGAIVVSAPSHEAAKSLAPASFEPEVQSPERLLNAAMEFFRSDDWAFERLADRSALRLPFQGRNGKWSCLAHARVTAALEQLLFYSVLPLNMPDEKRAAVAEFITRANYAMAIGNFEMDFSDGEVPFKTSIDATDVELTADLIRPLVYVNCLMMDKYLPGILAVLYADTPPAEAVKQIEG